METSTDDVHKKVEAACEAAARGDAATVMISLESRAVDAPTGLDELLLPMSIPAEYLLKHLNDGPYPPEHALRALMSIPSCYETPWRAALHMIQAFHSQSGNLGKQSGKVLWTCVTDVQTFLQLTVEAWWKLERQRTSSTRKYQTMHTFTTTTSVVPRLLLEQLVGAILKPLNSEDMTPSRDNQHWTQPLELVTTIVSLCQDLEPDGNGTLSDHVLNRLFPPSRQAIRPNRLLTWLTVASDLRSHLRSNDWTRLHDILHDSITQNTDSIPPSDLPGLVRGIVFFLVKQDDEEHEWELLILHLLHSASQHATTYSTVETVLKSSLASLPNPILKRCIHAVKDGSDNVPNWICSNMNLLLLQAVQESGSQLVSSLVARALGKHQGVDGASGVDWQRQCWESLKQLAFPSSKDAPRINMRRKQNDKSMVDAIASALGGVYYQGNGKFSSVDDGGSNSCGFLSSELVCQSIFLGQPRPSKRSHHIFASERAQLWVHAANTVLRPSLDVVESGVLTSLDALFAILITVTVYCEVPASRSTIVRTMMQCLSGTDTYMVSKHVPAFHCAAIAIIVRSLPHNSEFEDGSRELRPLADTFGESLRKDVFCDLTTALSPLTPARSALLSISRKYLQSSFGGNLWWGMGTASRGMQENRDRVDCALHGLCTLLATENQQSWDGCGIDSWAILSNILVQNQPALPMSERSALFRRLTSFAQNEKFSNETIEHLLRACLVRLLQFFDGETEELDFVPDRVFVSWGSRDASNAVGPCISQKEDITGLLRLVMLLLEKHARVSDEEAKGLRQGSASILRLLLSQDLPSDESSEIVMINSSTEILDETPREGIYLCSFIACTCVLSILRSAVSCNVSMQPTSGIRNTGTREKERWREHLISTEIEKCTLHGVTDDLGKLLLWANLSEAGDETVRRSTPCDSSMKSQLLSALCDIVMDLVFHPNLSEGTGIFEGKRTQQKSQMKCATSLVCLKMDLSKQRHDGIHVKGSELPEVAFDSTTLSVSAVPFLELYANSIEESLSNKASLNAAENIFVSLLTYCSALKQLANVEEANGNVVMLSTRVEIIRRLWNLYLGLCDESSAKRLVKYLEEQGVSQLELHDESTSRRSFLNIETDSDVDGIVQHVRFSIVSTMDALLQSLIRYSCAESPVTSWIGASKARASGGVNGGISLPIWLQYLRTLTLDLRAGLDGHSGGMTGALYASYLLLIEGTCKLASPLKYEEMNSSLASQASKTALECAAILKEILCRFPLRGAAQFKKTMLLSTLDLPTMHLQAIVMQVASGDGLAPSCSSGFAVEVFYQMMHVSERQYRLGKNKTVKWPEIAGAKHSIIPVDDDAVNDGDDNDDDSMNGIDGPTKDSSDRISKVPATIAIPGSSTNQTSKSDTGDDAEKIQLPSKESLVWASCCSLVAMEQVWSESNSILNGNTADLSFQTSPQAASSWAPYYLERTKALSDMLKAACFAMKTLEELKMNGTDDHSKENESVILATTVADVVKVRLCMLLEKLSTVLQVALQLLLSHLKKCDGLGYVERAEIMACLSAWLTMDAEEQSIESLSRRWYQAEKKLSRGEGSAGGVHQRQSPALKRLPKFLVRTQQELETDLSKVYQVLVKTKQEGNVSKQEVVDQYESLLGSQSNEGNASESLLSKVKSKLKSLAKDRASSDLTLLGDETGTPRKRSRRVPSLERQMRKERRRNIKRSRNRIVDNWLHLDDEHEMDEGADDDAFVDLEDFIVDG